MPREYPIAAAVRHEAARNAGAPVRPRANPAPPAASPLHACLRRQVPQQGHPLLHPLDLHTRISRHSSKPRMRRSGLRDCTEARGLEAGSRQCMHAGTHGDSRRPDQSNPPGGLLSIPPLLPPRRHLAPPRQRPAPAAGHALPGLGRLPCTPRRPAAQQSRGKYKSEESTPLMGRWHVGGMGIGKAGRQAGKQRRMVPM